MGKHADGEWPYLGVRDGRAAIDFYKRAFGAEEISRDCAGNGEKVIHAALKINGGTVFLVPGERLTGVTLHLEVENADSWWSRALRAGATVAQPLERQFWGDRYGQLNDPFGHSWSISSLLKD